MPKRPQIHIGTSGWVYQHWRGVFYPRELPAGRWFEHYCQHFSTVEVNYSFYRLPPESTFDAWQRQAPRRFLYAVKASRFLTHMKKLQAPEEPLERILGRARRLGDHLGPVLYQLPPRWKCNLERLRAFLAVLPRDLLHVLEFREPSWCNEQVEELLREARISYCIHDMGGSRWPLWATGPIVYVRFHGPAEQKYHGKYTPKHLRGWADRIEEFRRSGRDVFVYFNNDPGGHAVRNALQLKGMLGATH